MLPGGGDRGEVSERNPSHWGGGAPRPGLSSSAALRQRRRETAEGRKEKTAHRKVQLVWTLLHLQVSIRPGGLFHICSRIKTVGFTFAHSPSRYFEDPRKKKHLDAFVFESD